MTDVEYVWAPPDFDGGDGLLAIVIRQVGQDADSHDAPIPVRFYTPRDCQIQVGVIKYPAGHTIQPHVHTGRRQYLDKAPEVILVRCGRVRVDFYTSHRQLVTTKVLVAEDVAVLLCGGHGFHVTEDCELYEVRQGPHLGDEDKVRFTPGESDG